MNFGNRLIEFYEGEGRREMYRGSAERDFSTRKVAAIALWNKVNYCTGTMTVPYNNLKEINGINDLGGFILWVEVAHGDNGSALGISSLERAEWTPDHDIDIDYFK